MRSQYQHPSSSRSPLGSLLRPEFPAKCRFARYRLTIPLKINMLFGPPFGGPRHLWH